MTVLSEHDRSIVHALIGRSSSVKKPTREPAPARPPPRLRPVTTIPASRCVYCGAPTDSWTCHAHADLPDVDPEYRS